MFIAGVILVLCENLEPRVLFNSLGEMVGSDCCKPNILFRFQAFAPAVEPLFFDKVD